MVKKRACDRLEEANFICEATLWSSFSFWLSALAFACFIFLLLVASRALREFEEEKRGDPFLRVTNREFSLFLFQFPLFMRLHAPPKGKGTYLQGFFSDRENMQLFATEELVCAPPDLLFLYHTWQRLLARPFIARAISPVEFAQFLDQLPEWQPKNWPSAPSLYVQWVESQAYMNESRLESVSEAILPLVVRQAFIGWKNYFIEGKAINELQPTLTDLSLFLEHYPHYGRSYWRNISEIKGKKIAGANYLASSIRSFAELDREAPIPREELSSFLLVALFNFTRAKQEGLSQTPLHK